MADPFCDGVEVGEFVGGQLDLSGHGVADFGRSIV
jgi:hypothetical protein